MGTKSIELYIFLLERNETPAHGEWAKCLVAATSEKAAGEIANEASEAEGYVWNDGARTSIRRIGIADDGVQGLIMQTKD